MNITLSFELFCSFFPTEKCKSLDNFTINTTTCKICKQDFPRGRGYLLGHIGKAHLNEIKDGDDTNNDDDNTDLKQSETVPAPPKVSQSLHKFVFLCDFYLMNDRQDYNYKYDRLGHSLDKNVKLHEIKKKTKQNKKL